MQRERLKRESRHLSCGCLGGSSTLKDTGVWGGGGYMLGGGAIHLVPLSTSAGIGSGISIGGTGRLRRGVVPVTGLVGVGWGVYEHGYGGQKHPMSRPIRTQDYTLMLRLPLGILSLFQRIRNAGGDGDGNDGSRDGMKKRTGTGTGKDIERYRGGEEGGAAAAATTSLKLHTNTETPATPCFYVQLYWVYTYPWFSNVYINICSNDRHRRRCRLVLYTPPILHMAPLPRILLKRSANCVNANLHFCFGPHLYLHTQNPNA
ncbi:hypothetical protein D9758_015269 [Tetrapyrgos nigripes]|uniref:Uncharacterized protein n=1 Tax=Tetrapyrgos nigripes TaxID=182062 RepID=A0A8H5FQ95_9AGAR|nr:hypothetical protein D9758_015269 [Tetrapyrgos nigripes]